MLKTDSSLEIQTVSRHRLWDNTALFYVFHHKDRSSYCQQLVSTEQYVGTMHAWSYECA